MRLRKSSGKFRDGGKGRRRKERVMKHTRFDETFHGTFR